MSNNKEQENKICPNCTGRYRATASLKIMALRCKKCQKVFYVGQDIYDEIENKANFGEECHF